MAGPEDIDAAFAEIVAELEQDPRLARWPDELPERGEEASPGSGGSASGSSRHADADTSDSPGATQGLFEPFTPTNSDNEGATSSRSEAAEPPWHDSTSPGDSGETPSLGRPHASPSDLDDFARVPLDPDLDDLENEGHFEPPEPPPMPAPRPATLGGVAIIAVGVLLLVAPGVLGLSTTLALPLGLITVSSGLTWLLFRLRDTPTVEEDGDDGAQV